MGQKAMAGTIIKGGTGTTIQSILSSTITPVITTGGQVLYKTTEGIEFIAPKGMKTVNDIFR